MRNKTLNTLIYVFLFLTIAGAFLVSGDISKSGAVMKFIRKIYVIQFGITTLLLICKLASSMFLDSLKGRPISTIEAWFIIYYPILTKEARAECTKYIEDEKLKS